jgi:prepilin-type N-terminal cleavage/methylation domain-containing protein
MTRPRRHPGAGFTLLELSIVLVIIGLIVGGVLVGRDLIEVASIRAQISQIEKYQTAVHTFETKFNCLPGDCANAADFGFAARGTGRGEGDGNGVLESQGDSGIWNGSWQANGEVCGFWRDLSQAQLVAGSFNYCALSRAASPGSHYVDVSSWLPAARIGQGDYVTVYSGGAGQYATNGINYFGVSRITAAPNWVNWPHYGTGGLTVQQAYAIDSKIDDGLPQSGTVTAMYLTVSYIRWANNDNSGNAWTDNYGPGDGTPTPPSATTCYDDGGVTGATRQYSMTQNSGSGINCGLSFQFE